MASYSENWTRNVGGVTVRPPRESDVEQIFGWRNSPEVAEWLLRTSVTADELREALLDFSPQSHSHRLVAEEGEEVVGVGDLWVYDAMTQSHVDQGPVRLAEAGLGYVIRPGRFGKGYATLIASTLLDLAFTDLGVRRVVAGCFADNHASARVLEKIGMRRESHSVADVWHAELGWLDGYGYALLSEEWREAQHSSSDD